MLSRQFPACIGLSAGLFLAALCPGQQQAQEGGGSLLRGRILDPTHAAVAGARITATPAGGRAGQAVRSGPDGEFSLALTAGYYRLTVSADGFPDLAVDVAAPLSRDEVREFILPLAQVRETVNVVGSAGYQVAATASGSRTLTLLRDLPQSVTVVTAELIRDQMMLSIGDVVRYVPGVTAQQGENNRDQVVIRGNSSSADFFVDGVRDDMQYFRDLYNVDRVEALKGPNALTFGRGGGGGVINRVTKTPRFAPLGQLSLGGGAYGQRRFAADLERPAGRAAALRFNGVYENSGSFRRYAGLERAGIAPTLAVTAGSRTRAALSYEYFRDRRTADRGIPSYQGRPAAVPLSAYFGDPGQSYVRGDVHLAAVALEHRAGSLGVRNRTQFAAYDRAYQNFVPGAVTTDMSQVTLTAYGNATTRRNLFNQTDLSREVRTGPVRHTLLAGAEAGRQITDNFRRTGYFEDRVTSWRAPLEDAAARIPVTFRQSATDANNHIRAVLGAAYVQDQVELSRRVQLIAGMRFDHFYLRYHNNRNQESLRRADRLFSPRAGIVLKPADALSVYWSYSVSYLPSSGDQFSSLTTVTEQVKPERFFNREAGIKWDLARGLSLTAAVYRLDRANTRSTDPADPTRIVQTGSQRTDGIEAGISGNLTRSWQAAGGFAYQDATVTRATISAPAGVRVAQVPRGTFSFWNYYQIRPRLGAGLGVLSRSDMFAAIDNTVVLPGYTRLDAAVFYSMTERTRLQVNVENLLDRRYYLNANSNSNISPGSPLAVRAGLITTF